MARYVVLLRGINVGGKRKVPMADLREALEAHGSFADVSTYIQSGNVLLTSTDARAGLEETIETVLDERFGFPIPVMVRSHAQLRSVVTKAPRGFGAEPDVYHSDVVFLKRPLTEKQAVARFAIRDGVDQIWPGTGVVYFARLSERRTQSKMSSVVGTPEYQLMTIRSWTTTLKLLDLLDA